SLVSLVDGFNIPMAITNNVDCPVADCPVDLNANYTNARESAGPAELASDAEGACPNSYAYAYDESSNTALWTCDSSLNADYTLTFCP
ncbi:hypothetical protein MPER_09417, partial [Moniliophthora perniciosa FA553]